MVKRPQGPHDRTPEMDKFEEMRSAYGHLKQEVNELEYQMGKEALNFSGTVREAVLCGMVKFNFPMSRSLTHKMNN